MLDPNTTALLERLGVGADTVESMMSALIVLTVISLIAAVPTAIIAKRKDRSTSLWLLLALSIPVLPLLLVWLLPKAGGPVAAPPGKPPARPRQ